MCLEKDTLGYSGFGLQVTLVKKMFWLFASLGFLSQCILLYYEKKEGESVSRPVV